MATKNVLFIGICPDEGQKLSTPRNTGKVTHAPTPVNNIMDPTNLYDKILTKHSFKIK